MEQSDRHSAENIEVLKDKRRKAAARVRRLLEALERAEREFNAATREVTENRPGSGGVPRRRYG